MLLPDHCTCLHDSGTKLRARLYGHQLQPRLCVYLMIVRKMLSHCQSTKQGRQTVHAHLLCSEM